MAPDTWMSIGLGVAIGLFHALASLVVSRVAGRFASQGFLKYYMGGLAIRLIVTVVLVVSVVMLVSIDPVAFLLSFALVFMFGLLWEVMRLHRRALTRP
jgi:hypothetical protein